MLILMVGLDAVYNCLAGYWVANQQRWYVPLIATVVLVLMGWCFLAALLQGAGMVKATLWFGVLSALAGAVVGVLFLGETLLPYQMAGVALGVCGIYLLR